MPNQVGGLLILPFGGPLVSTFCYAGTVEEGKNEFAKFQFNSPINTLKPMSYQTGVQRLALGPNGDGQAPGYYFEKGCLTDTLTDDLIDILWKMTHEVPDNVEGAVVMVPLGGKMADVPEDATAFEVRQAKYWILILGTWKDYTHREANVAFIRKIHSAVIPFGMGQYAAIIGEDAKSLEESNGSGIFKINSQRLSVVKAKYDPKNMFRQNRNILPQQ